jgi:ferredoxin
VLEKAMVQFGQIRKDPNVRLACQIQVLDDCQVETRCARK